MGLPPVGSRRRFRLAARIVAAARRHAGIGVDVNQRLLARSGLGGLRLGDRLLDLFARCFVDLRQLLFGADAGLEQLGPDAWYRPGLLGGLEHLGRYLV